jgi:hypothetical protein
MACDQLAPCPPTVTSAEVAGSAPAPTGVPVSPSGWARCADSRTDLSGSAEVAGGLPADPLADVWAELAALSSEWESAHGWLPEDRSPVGGPGWDRPVSDRAVLADEDGAWLPVGCWM